MQAEHGYDNPSSDREKDDLDRWRFALDIADVIRNTPANWSARIGLFGSWGAGKSTVLAYLAEELQSKGCVVVKFNPSFDGSFEDVMNSFGIALLEELSKRRLLVEPKLKASMRKVRWLGSKRPADIADAASSLFKGAKLVSIGLRSLSEWLAPDGNQIKRLTEELMEQRLVVLIDDLDRTSAELLPKFLLSLREVLDLPRFTFVLAFDKNIVAKAVLDQNPSWSEGDDFLAKVLDFRFSLPAVSGTGKRRLLQRMVSDLLPSAPMSSIDEVEDLIPTNPRKLKAIVRELASMTSIVSRHKEDEFSWTDLWLVQLMRSESQAFYDLLSDSATFDRVLGMNYRLSIHMSRSYPASTKADEAEALLNALKTGDDTKERLRKIVDAMRARSSSHLAYVFRWSTSSPEITWKEFDALIASWRNDPSPKTLDAWISHHACCRRYTVEAIQQKICEALCEKSTELLNTGEWKRTAEAAAEVFKQYHELQGTVVHFFQLEGSLSTARFMLFYNLAQYWITIRRFPFEQEARDVERANLITFARCLSATEQIVLYEHLEPVSATMRNMMGVTADYRSELRDELAQEMQGRVEEQLIEFLQDADFLKKLGEQGRFKAFKQLLFSASRTWSDELHEAINRLIAAAHENPKEYQIVESLLDSLVDALAYKSSPVEMSQARAMVSDADLMPKLWSAVLSKRLLPFTCTRLLAKREKLIASGSDETNFQLDKQLLEQLPLFKEHHDQIMRDMGF